MNYCSVLCSALTLMVLISRDNFFNPDPDMVLWGEKKIMWDDFKGSPPEDYDTTVGAITATSIQFEQVGSKGMVPLIKVYCYFVRNESWTLVDDEYSLKHERLHFDIAELYARKMRKSIDSLISKNVSDITAYEKVVAKHEMDYDACNNRYDSEVYFNKKRQAQWNAKIPKELQKLKKYELKADK